MDRLDFAIKISRKVGNILLSEWGGPISVSQKSSFQDLVTNMDKKVQEIIVSSIRENFPDEGVLAEEGLDDSSDKMWIIDPIDGTVNFVFGLPSFSISIAYVENGEPIIGVVHLPVLSETYYAIKGGGAYKNGEKIRVSKRKNLRESLGLMGFFKDFSGRLLSDLEDKVVRVRMLGSIAVGVSYIAAGKADFYVAKRSNPWDVAAAILILKEAGGRVTDFSGKDEGIFGKEYVFSNGYVHDELLERLSLIQNLRVVK